MPSGRWMRTLLLLVLALALLSGSAHAAAGVDASEVRVTGALYGPHFLRATGFLRSDIPIKRIELDLVKLSTGEVLSGTKKSFQVPVNTLSVADLYSRLLMPGDDPGAYYRVTATVTLEDGSEYVRNDTICSLPPKYSEPDSVTSRCRITPEAEGRYVKDRDYWTEWKAKAGQDTLDIECPGSAEKLVVSWRDAEHGYTVDCLNEAGSLLCRYERDRDQHIYRASFELPKGTCHIRITSEAGGGITELRVYSAKNSGYTDMEPLPEKTDILVFSAHPDDELLWFGGAIPSCAARGKTVGVVYMTCGSWMRRNESLKAMWTCGVKYHPLYLEMTDVSAGYEQTAAIWEREDGLLRTVRTLRRYKPEVVLTHDLNGEYGHSQHKLTASTMLSAVEKANDPAYDPSSAAMYGTWQVKKLYLHLYGDNASSFRWDDAVNEWGLTSLDAACVAFEAYISQQGRWNMEKGVQYDNTRFGLAYTTVGPDTGKGDLFENIWYPEPIVLGPEYIREPVDKEEFTDGVAGNRAGMFPPGGENNFSDAP